MKLKYFIIALVAMLSCFTSKALAQEAILVHNAQELKQALMMSSSAESSAARRMAAATADSYPGTELQLDGYTDATNIEGMFQFFNPLVLDLNGCFVNGNLTLSSGQLSIIDSKGTGAYIGTITTNPGAVLVIGSGNIISNGGAAIVNGGVLTIDGGAVIGKITDNGGTITEDADYNMALLADVATMQKALNVAIDGQGVKFAQDIEGNVTVSQVANVSFVIDGQGKKFDGTIIVDGNSRNPAAETLTIQNVNFETSAKDRYFVDANDASVDNRYSHNVTIKNCNFTAVEGSAAHHNAVAARFRQAFNIKIEGGVFTNMHSVLQAYGVIGVEVSGVKTVNSKNGVSFGTSQNAVLKNVEFADCVGYGVRADAEVNTTLTVENAKIEAFIPVVVRKATANYNVAFNGENTMNATNTDGIWFAAGTSEYETNGTMPTDATGKVKVTLNDTGLNAAGVYGDYVPVAKIGDVEYTSLEAAFAAATEGQTITMLDDVTPALTSQRAITKAAVIDLDGKTMTLTEDDLYFGTTTFKNGTIVVEPSVKPSTAVFWMFANQTLTFDNVKIVATGVTGTYLIGLEGDNSDLNLLNGSEILVENTTALDLDIICVNGTNTCDIKVENSKVNVTNIDGRVFFRGNYTVKDSEVNLAGITKAGFRIEAGQTLSIEGTSKVNIEGELRDGGIHMTDLSATYTKAETATVNATVNEPKVAKVGDNTYRTLAQAVAAVEDGGTITLIANETFAKNNRYNNGGWWDGLGYSGDKSFTIDLAGFTISQDGSLNDYLLWFKNAGSKENTITIKNGTLDAGTTAYCALCTASSHDNKLTINTEDLTLINNISNGSTVKVRAGSVLNVKNGTKITGKNSYLGIENWNATVNIYDGAEIYMNGTASYNGCLVGVGGGGTVNVYGGYGKGVKGGFIAMTSGGTINVKGGEWIANTDGTVGNNSNLYVLTAQSNKYESGFAGASIINVTGGTLRGGMDAWVLNNLEGEKAELNITGGNFNANPTNYIAEDYIAVENNGVWNVVKAAAKVGNELYASLEAAFKAATSGCTIEILENVTVDYAWDARYTGGKFTVPVTINGNGKTIKFTASVNDNNYQAPFRFEADATVKNLTIDMSEVTDNRFRAISSKGNLTVEGCKFIGKDETLNCRAIIFGEGAGENVGNLAISITNSEFINWKRGITDNENAQDVKTVTITGNTLTNAGVGVSAKETVTFTGNTVEGAYVNIKSYTASNSLNVVATGNTLEDNTETAYNVINAGGTINAQDGFKASLVAKIGEATYGSLQAAINAVKNGETITLVSDIVGNVTLTEKVGLYYTIDGAGKTMNGSMTITPLSDGNDNRRITIQNINFVNTAEAGRDFISCTVTNHYPRLTVDGCTFTGNYKETDVALRLKTAYGAVIKNCTGTGLHSFLQNTAGLNLTIENVKVTDSKSAFALGTVQGVTVKGCEADVEGYGIRLDAQYNNNAVIESNKIEAFIPVVVRKAEVNSNIAFNGENTMTATNDDGIWCAVGTSEYETNGQMPTAATGKVKVNLNGTGLDSKGVYGNFGVASIGTVNYNTLAEALTAAVDGDVVTLNWSEGDAPIAMNGSVFGKNVTIKGTAKVDWSKGFLFVGRGGEGDATVTFDEANLTSASNNASTGIHVSGREKNTTNKYDGTLVIKNSTIELDYLINKGAMTLDKATLTVKNGCAIGGRPATETKDGQDATATISLTNESKLVVSNHNGMGLGYEAIGVMNIDATSTFETTQSFLVTAKGTMNIAGKATVAGTLTNNGAINMIDKAAILTSSECGNVTTNVADHKVVYANGTYKVVAKKYVAIIDENRKFETFKEALDAIQNGETITLVADEYTEGKESGEIEFDRAIAFTITGKSTKYALPVVTFQNAKVTIKDAEILIPELDARQNAVINIVNSTVHDAGGNSIAKSYYNGTISIDANSTVHMMQVTTMGYINVAGTLNATWQTNVYGNGIITLAEGAKFNTAALHLTGKDYSGRDNTDADRVGKPATIVVDGATLNVGKVIANNGSDYSYNSSKGINVGTVDGKQALLDIKNGGAVNFHMANGQTTNFGAGATVNVASSTLKTICRDENGTVTLANNGSVYVTGNSQLDVKKYSGNAMKIENANLADSYFAGNVNAFGTNNISGTTEIGGILSVGYSGSPAEQVVVNITGNFKGTNVLVGSSNESVLNLGVAESSRTTAHFGQLGASGDVNVANADVTYAYAFIRNDFNAINSTFAIKDGVNTYFSGNAKVVLDNTTWSLPGYANIGSYGDYMYGNADVTLKNGSSMTATNLGIEVDGEKVVKLTLEDSSTFTATALKNQGSIVLAGTAATLTSNEVQNVTTSVADHKVVYADGSYEVVAKKYVATIDENRKYESFEEALANVVNGDIITLVTDCGENVTIQQKKGVSFTIDGDNKTYTGTITVKGDGTPNGNNTETLTFKNIKFVAKAGVYAITAAKGTHARNITVDGCTFTGTDTSYGIRVRNGWNYAVKNTTVDGLRSFFYASENLSGLTVENVTVTNTTSAFNAAYGFGNATFKNVNINVAENGIWIKNQNAFNMTLENCSIAVAKPIQVEEYGKFTNSITLNGTNNLVAANDGNWLTIVDAPAVDATFKVLANDTALDFEKTSGLVAYAKNVERSFGCNNLQKVVSETIDGDVVTLLADVAMDTKTFDTQDDNYAVLFNAKDKNLTFDLNGKAIIVNAVGADFANANGQMLLSVFHADINGHMTVTDNSTDATGSVTLNVNDAKVYSFFASESNENSDKTKRGVLTVKGGKFTTVGKLSNAMFFSDTDEAITVSGGNFHLDGDATGTQSYPWMVNTLYNNELKVVFEGGTFSSDINHHYRPFEAYVPENLAVKNNGNGTWTIVQAQAYVTEMLGDNVNKSGDNEHKVGYATIAEAIAATNDLGKTVTILAGDYAQDIRVNKAGITVQGEVDENGYKLVNITGRVVASTGTAVKNLNVKNENKGQYDCALCVDGKDIVIDGVNLSGYNGMRMCYAKGNITIKNSVIEGSSNAVHFDGDAGGVIVFENSTITGWCAYASTIESVTYTNCTLNKGNYHGQRFYNANVNFDECTFGDGFKIELTGKNQNVSFTDEDMTMDDVKALMYKESYITSHTITLNDAQVTYAVSAQGKLYNTLQAAIDALPVGGTATYWLNLKSDNVLTEGVVVPAGVKATINLNGFNIIGTPAEAKAYAVITNRGTLTIEGNGSVICNHTLDGSIGYAVNTITNLGTLTIENGVTVENKSTALYQIGYAIDNNSTSTDAVVNIYGGKVTASGSLYYDGIRQFCNSETKENSVVVSGGEVSTIWMQNPSDGGTKNTKDVKGSIAISGGNVGVLSLEPSANFEAAVTDGHVGDISYFQTAAGRDLVEFVTGGTFGTEIDEAFLALGYQLIGDAAPYGVMYTGSRKAMTFVDGEFTEYVNDKDIEVEYISYTRNITGVWTPLYVPFEVDVEQLAAQGLEVAYINGVRRGDEDYDGILDDPVMEVIYIHGGKADGTNKTLKANYPYFVKSANKDVTVTMEIVLENATLFAASDKTYDCTTMTEKYDIIGNSSVITVKASDNMNIRYTMAASGWSKRTKDSSLKPFRFHMEISSRDGSEPVESAASSVRIVVRGHENEDGTTTIYDVVGTKQNSDVIYDIHGRRVLDPQKGNFYIINGKKVVY